MRPQNLSESSLDSISIKLTQSNLPSATIIRTSQQHISLTYTVSIEKISDQMIHIPNLRQSENFMISIQSKKGSFQKASRYRKITSKDEDNQLVIDKDVFKKKSVLKISNMDFSILAQQDKNQQSPVMIQSRKTPIKSNNSGILAKTKSPQNDSMIQSRIHSRSKETVLHDYSENCAQNFFMRTTRFYSFKKDKVVEPKNGKKISIRKEVERKSQHFETDRKYSRLPIIKGSNFHSSAPSSMAQKRKVYSCHQNAEVNEKQMGRLTAEMIFGKSYKISENDQKAKKYLQKIIQNRNSIIHYSENRSNKISKQFKENIEDFF